MVEGTVTPLLWSEPSVAAPIAGDARPARCSPPRTWPGRPAHAALDVTLPSGHVTIVGAPPDSLGDQPG